MHHLKRKAVVTGMGVISSAGNNLNEFGRNIRAGSPCFSDIDAGGIICRAGAVRNFDSRRLGTHLLDPFIQYAVAACDEALRDAGFDFEGIDPYTVGISVSSSKGGMYTLSRFKERLEKNPSAMLGARVYANLVPNFAAQWIARRWKIKGPAKCYISACATGTTAVIEGARMVQEGVVDYCIAGASDASIVPLMLAGYRNMRVLAKSEMRPFDARRSGFLVGEGAGIVFIESEESARKRGAAVYGSILGGFYGADAHDKIYFSEEEDALAKTLKRAVDACGGAVGYMNLHGTATKSGDLYETRQIKKALKARAHTVPMSATKSITGHALGASGALEVIITLLAMKRGFIPPTAGLEQADENCDLDYVAGKSRETRIKNALSLSMGFGGHVAVIALENS